MQECCIQKLGEQVITIGACRVKQLPRSVIQSGIDEPITGIRLLSV